MAIRAASAVFFNGTLPPIIEILNSIKKKTGLSYFLKIQSLNTFSGNNSILEESEELNVSKMGESLYWGEFTSNMFENKIEITALERGFSLESFSSSSYFFCSIINVLVELGGEISPQDRKHYLPDWKDEKWNPSKLPPIALKGRRKKRLFFNVEASD